MERVVIVAVVAIVLVFFHEANSFTSLRNHVVEPDVAENRPDNSVDSSDLQGCLCDKNKIHLLN